MTITPKNMTEAIRRDEANKRVRAFLRALEKRAKDEYDTCEILAESRDRLRGESGDEFIRVQKPDKPYDFLAVVDIARKDPRVQRMKSPMVALSSLFVDAWDDFECVDSEDQATWNVCDPRSIFNDDDPSSLTIRFVDDYKVLHDYEYAKEFNGLFERGVKYGIETVAHLLDAIIYDSSDKHMSFGAQQIVDAAGRLAKQMLDAERDKDGSLAKDAWIEEEVP